VIGASGTQVGVIGREEALRLAREQELDLVEVAENAQPPVARIIDFTKFRYQEEKKEQAARKKAKDVELKEVWLSPRIAQHDLEVRLKKADEFLEKGNKVKLTIKFKGREMAHPETGYQVVNQVLAYWGDKILIERETKFEGRNLTTIVGQSKKKPEQQKEKEENAES
jgi:translation initiation factor IF-3